MIHWYHWHCKGKNNFRKIVVHITCHHWEDKFTIELFLNGFHRWIQIGLSFFNLKKVFPGK